MNYEQFKEELIKKGADAELFDMPAIKKRLEFKELSVDDVTINKDGTFNYKNSVMSKEKTETGENVIAIIELTEEERHLNSALDGQFALGDDYDSSFTNPLAILTCVNSEGIEVQRKVIDNEYYINSEKQKGGLTFKSFSPENPDVIFEEYAKEGGFIRYSRKSRFAEAIDGNEYRFYDHGNWCIKNPVYKGGSQSRAISDSVYSGFVGDRESPSLAMQKFDLNTERLVSEYPQLEGYAKTRKADLMSSIDAQMKSMVSQNEALKSSNEKLQEMLSKSLEFAQKVRDSRVGRVFFGKQAKAILGEKDAKKLPDGR
jgi:regulator of replication initiation timing